MKYCQHQILNNNNNYYYNIILYVIYVISHLKNKLNYLFRIY